MDATPKKLSPYEVSQKQEAESRVRDRQWQEEMCEKGWQTIENGEAQERQSVTNLSKLDRYKFALGKFTKAVETLATLPTRVTDRLFSASLDFAVVRPEDLPQELHKDFVWIKEELTKRPDLNIEYRKGDILNTLYRMRGTTGSRIAARIVSVERELRRICDEIDSNILNQQDRKGGRTNIE